MVAEIVRKASAGTLESSDIYVEIEPAAHGIEIQLESVVKEQFGQTIENIAHEVLLEHQVDRARLHLIDRGALDCVIRARVETAILRGAV